MITKKILYFNKIDDKFFTEIAKEIDNGYTVREIHQNPWPNYEKVKLPDDFIPVELLNYREGIGF